MEDLQQKQSKATRIFVDNKSAIALTKNPVHHERSKHIDTRFHFIREHIKEGDMELSKLMNNCRHFYKTIED